jgi:hypothetical protein
MTEPVNKSAKDREWDRVLRRLRSTAESGDGPLLITTTVVVVDGIPKFFTRPSVIAVEPRSQRDAFVRFLAFGVNPDYN